MKVTRMMRVKKVRRKCNVRGCNSLDCYSISRSSESGNSIIICKECLSDALKAVEAFEKMKKDENKVYKPLFYHPEDVNVETDGESTDNNSESNGEGEIFVCPVCGKEFKSERGLKTHMKVHESNG